MWYYPNWGNERVQLEPNFLIRLETLPQCDIVYVEGVPLYLYDKLREEWFKSDTIEGSLYYSSIQVRTSSHCMRIPFKELQEKIEELTKRAS